MLKSIAAALLIAGLPATVLLAADNPANPPQQSAPAAEAPAPSGGDAAAGGSPTETARKAEKGMGAPAGRWRPSRSIGT